MANTPLVSIVIACRAGDERLQRTLRSALIQTFPAVDIIVAGIYAERGGMPGNPPAAARFYSVANLTEAWNYGVNQGAGKYVCCVQAGEELLPTYIEKCIFLLETRGFDLCAAWERTASGDTRYPGPLHNRALPADNVSSGAAVIRKSALRGLAGFDEQIPIERQRWDLRIRLGNVGALACIMREVLVLTEEPILSTGIPAAEFLTRHENPGPDQPTPDAAGEQNAPGAGFSYENLIAGDRPHPPTVLLAMPFLTMGGGEAIISQICRQLKMLGFRLLIVTTVPVVDNQGDTTAWFEDSVAGIYHLPRFLDMSLWPAFIAYLIQQHSIGVLWQAGSSFTYNLLAHLRQLFPAMAVVDLLFNPEGHTANYLKYSYLIDHVVTEHQAMKQWLMERGEAEERISVIPNGVDLESHSPQPRLDWQTRQLRAESDGRFVVGFVGRLSEEKGPGLFLEIAAMLVCEPGLEFVVCGGGPMEAQLRGYAADNGLGGRVHFLGFTYGRTGHLCCDAIVVCSRLDGRPNIVMESLAMGIPVVASRVGGIPEMLPEGSGGVLCDAHDSRAFAEAIVKLAGDRDWYQQLSKAARSHAVEHFSIAENGRRYADLFRAVEKRRAGLHRQITASSAAASLGLAPGAGSRPRRVSAVATCRLLLSFLMPSRLVANCRNAWLYWSLAHHKQGGRFRRPPDHFDSTYYVETYPDVADAGLPPLLHFLLSGFREGRNPSRTFNSGVYIDRHPDVARSGLNPLLHYLASGQKEGRL